MKWISVKDKLPKDFHKVLISNFGYLDPKNARFYVVAEKRGDIWQDPDMDKDNDEDYYHAPDYWCEIEPPPTHPDAEGRCIECGETGKHLPGCKMLKID